MGSNESMLSCILHKNLSKTLLLVKICWGLGVLRNSNRQDKSKEWLWIPPWNSSTPSLCTAEKQPPHNQIWSPLHQTLYSTLCTLQTIVLNRSVEFRGTGLCPLVHHGAQWDLSTTSTTNTIRYSLILVWSSKGEKF